MPATKQEIDDLTGKLETLAQTIHDDSISLAETIAAIDESIEEIETMKATHLAAVLSDRFEINNKLKYTNDDRRKVAVQELLSNDANYNAMKSAQTKLVAAQAERRAAIEKNRNLHKSKLLVLQYYASLP